MSDPVELYYAHMEADRNEIEEAYFKARPSLGTEVDRALFRAGFERAYAKVWPLAVIKIDESAAQETAAAQNTGHGHVRPRPDGVRARCGGPGLCAVCSREAALNREASL